jgi:hypothetical protein
LQAEIEDLEKQLLQLDQKDALTDTTQYRLCSVKHMNGWDTTQKDLLEKLQMKLVMYGKQCGLLKTNITAVNLE